MLLYHASHLCLFCAVCLSFRAFNFFCFQKYSKKLKACLSSAALASSVSIVFQALPRTPLEG